MNPITLKQVWGLTYPQLAEVLPRTEETLRRYGFRTSAKKRMEPSADVCWMAQQVHEKWLNEGKAPVKPGLIAQNTTVVAP